jgi:23S rRNA (uracil1939-C5)-methyltransferase
MNEHPLTINKDYEIEISSLTSQGEGVGRIQGFAVFVDGALPNEVVQVKIIETKKRYARAKLLTIKQPSLHRKNPPCPLFGKCGGCQLMHLTYSEQLQIKRKKVEDAFQRIGHLQDLIINQCIPSPQEYNYRNKVQMPIVYSKAGSKTGFFKKKSHQVIDVETCHIHNPLGDSIYQKIRNTLSKQSETIQHIVIKTAIHTQQVLIILVSKQHNNPSLKDFAKEIIDQCPEVKGVLQNTAPLHGKSLFGKQWQTLAGDSRIKEHIFGLTFEVSGPSFFQVNTPQAEQLYNAVIKAAAIHKESIILDAYCGVGTLSLIASQHAKTVYGIEMVPEAIHDAQRNAKLNNITNCTFKCGLTENLIQHYKDVDVVILNPPRQGCESRVIKSLIASQPKTIVYVSCDPTTLARDLSMLRSSYTIESVQPFDMFPQTTHVETIVKLTNSGHC